MTLVLAAAQAWDAYERLREAHNSVLQDGVRPIPPPEGCFEYAGSCGDAMCRCGNPPGRRETGARGWGSEGGRRGQLLRTLWGLSVALGMAVSQSESGTSVCMTREALSVRESQAPVVPFRGR